MFKKTACMSLILIMMSAALLPFIPMAGATNDPNDTHAHVDVILDWTVTDTRTYTAGTQIHMNNVNVHVTGTGRLTLDASSILFTDAADGAKGITVDAGGYFEIKNNGGMSTFAGTNTYYCTFMPDSTIKIDHGAILYAGGDHSTPEKTGIYIGTKNTTVDNGVFGWNHNPAAVVYTDAPMTFRNTTFMTYQFDAIFAAADITLYDCGIGSNNIGANTAGLRTDDYTSATVVNTQITNQNGDGIVLGDFATLTAKTNRIHNNTGSGIRTGFFSQADLVDNLLNDDYDGLFVSAGAIANLTGSNRIINSKHHGISATNLGQVGSVGTYVKNSNNANLYAQTGTIDFAKGNIIQVGGQFNAQFMSRSTGTIQNTNVMGPVSNADITATDDSTLDVVDCTIDGANEFGVISSGAGAKVTVKGTTIVNSQVTMLASSDGHLLSKGNTFNQFGMMFFSFLSSTVVSENDKGASSIGNAGIAESMYKGSITMTGANIQLTGATSVIGIAVSESTFFVYDSLITQPTPWASYLAGDGGRTMEINSSGDPELAMAFSNGNCDFGWHTEVLTQWQNGAVAPMADVEFADTNATVMETLTTDANGFAAADVIAITVNETDTNYRNYYNISATSNGMSGLTNLNISDNKIGAEAIVIEIDDTSKPFVNITSPMDNLLTNGSTLDITGSVSDIGAGIEKVQFRFGTTGAWRDITDIQAGIYRVTGVDLAEDDQDYYVSVTDFAGNVVTAKHNITVDWTAPPLTVTEPAGLYVTSGTFYLNGTTEDGVDVTVDGMPATNTAGDFGIQLTLADGTYNISVEAVDAAGNVARTTKVLIVDTVPPKLTCDIKDGKWTNQTSFVLTGTTDGVSVNMSGTLATLDTVAKTWKRTVTLTEGANKFTIVAKDLAGNKNTTMVTINLDTKKPVISVTSPTGTMPYMTNKANMTITGKVTDATKLWVGGQALTIGTGGNFSTTVILTEGSNKVTIKAEREYSGDIVADSFFDVFIERDITPPVVVITAPKNGLVTNAASVQVTGTIDDKKATLKFGNTNITNTNGTFTTAATLTAGDNTLTVTATDPAGNTITASVKVTFDNVASLTVTSPKKVKVSVTSDSIKIEGTSEKGAVVTINGMAIPVDANGGFSVKYTLREGKNTLNVKSVDPAGNPATTTLTVTYNDAKKYEVGMLLGLGIVLMIVGLVLGLVVGRAMAKPKAPPPEQTAFTPEEEPAEKPAPKVEPKPEPKPAPKPEPKVEPKPAPKETPKVEAKDDSLDNLLKGLDKK